MRQSLKGLMGFVAVAALATPFSSVFAARVVQGHIMDVTGPDPFLRCAEERHWSGADPAVVNGNGVNTCATAPVGCNFGIDPSTLACNRVWTANVATSGRPGYVGFSDDKSTYQGDIDNQPMYTFWENIKNGTANNYASYYYAASQVASNADLGLARDNNCTGTGAVACFLPGYASRNGGTINNVPNGPILFLGGMAAIPVPRIVGSPVGNTANLAWDAVQVFANPDAAPNPFKFYRLYRWSDTTLNSTCDAPLESDPGWVAIGTPTSAAFTDPALPPTGTVDCVRYALKLVFNGPANINNLGNAVGELSSHFRSAASAGISRNPSASQITNFGATYIGKGTVNVAWTGAVETGLAGYYLNQALDSAGPYRRISDQITVRGDGTNYTFPNKVLRKDGTTFWYTLTLVKTDGSTSVLAPVSVTLPSKAD